MNYLLTIINTSKYVYYVHRHYNMYNIYILLQNNNDSSAEFKVGRQTIIDKLLNKQLKDIHTDIVIHIRIQYIYYIDGGGFVAMSSRSHQNYTRRWANSLNVPVFSIDYGLSPDNPFP